MTIDNSPRRFRTRRLWRGVVLALAVLGIVVQLGVLSVAGWAASNPRLAGDLITVQRFDPDPVVASYVTRAGMSERGGFVFFASTPQRVPASDFDDYCSRDEPGIGVLGCFTFADGRIYLYAITNPELADLEVVVAAHEMLHAAWDRLSVDDRRALEAPLEQAFAALGPDHELVERIALYEKADPRSRIPELYAILGTEIATLPAELEAHYENYFLDRSAVVAIWQGIEAIFRELDAELQRLSAELDALASTIEEEQASAASEATQLQADITAFNARAERPGGYVSQSAFERDRDALLQRQEALNERIVQTNALIDAYNALVAEFTALNEQAAALNRDLNVVAAPIDTIDTPQTGNTDDTAR